MGKERSYGMKNFVWKEAFKYGFQQVKSIKLRFVFRIMNIENTVKLSLFDFIRKFGSDNNCPYAKGTFPLKEDFKISTL